MKPVALLQHDRLNRTTAAGHVQAVAQLHAGAKGLWPRGRAAHPQSAPHSRA